jgi:hypothetical protein
LLRVIGRAQKEREVPLPVDVVGELASYLVSRGLDADPTGLSRRDRRQAQDGISQLQTPDAQPERTRCFKTPGARNCVPRSGSAIP